VDYTRAVRTVHSIERRLLLWWPLGSGRLLHSRRRCSFLLHSQQSTCWCEEGIVTQSFRFYKTIYWSWAVHDVDQMKDIRAKRKIWLASLYNTMIAIAKRYPESTSESSAFLCYVCMIMRLIICWPSQMSCTLWSTLHTFIIVMLGLGFIRYSDLLVLLTDCNHILTSHW